MLVFWAVFNAVYAVTVRQCLKQNKKTNKTETPPHPHLKTFCFRYLVVPYELGWLRGVPGKSVKVQNCAPDVDGLKKTTAMSKMLQDVCFVGIFLIISE